MGRGFLTGAVLGALVSVAFVVLISQWTGTIQLTLTAPEAGEAEVPPGTEFTREKPDLAPVLPGPEDPPAAEDAPSVAVPVAEVPPVADPAPAGEPQPVAEIGAALDEPAAPVAFAEPPDGEQAVLPTPTTVLPRQPRADDQPGALDSPEAPQTPQAEPADVALPAPGESGPGDAPAQEEAVAALSEAEPAAPPRADAEPAAPVAPETPDTAETPGEALAGPGADEPVAALPEVAPAEAPVTEAEPVAPVAPEAPDLEPEIAETEAPVPAVVPMPRPFVIEAPEVPQLPGAEVAALQPGPAPQAPPVAPPDDPTPEADADPADEQAAPTGPAIEAFAIPAQPVPSGVPTLSLVLIDTGPGRPEPLLLKDFPVPLTVVVDPTLPDAAQVMADYRAAGVEVAVLAPLPARAAPADIEVAFQSFLSAVPEAVAVVDLPEARLQENRSRAAQVAAILSETGHGMVTYERGLNSGLQVANRAGVPAATVELRVDGSGRNVSAIKRFLDQGAFRAGQSGRAILTGETRPETLQALAEWVLGTRAATVALVPLSVALRR